MPPRASPPRTPTSSVTFSRPARGWWWCSTSGTSSRRTTRPPMNGSTSLRREAPYLAWADIVFASALTGQRVERILREARTVADERYKRVPTPDLNKIVTVATTEPSGTDGPRPSGQGAVRHPGRGRAANVRDLRERPEPVPLQLSAVSREPDSRRVGVQGHPDPAHLPRAGVGTGGTPGGAATPGRYCRSPSIAVGRAGILDPMTGAAADRITVIGAGAWGTTLARMLAGAGQPVTLWSHRSEFASEMAGARENVRYLPGHAFPSALAVTGNDADLGRTPSAVPGCGPLGPSAAHAASGGTPSDRRGTGAVGGQGHRVRHPGPDERGHRRRGSRASGRGAVGAEHGP